MCSEYALTVDAVSYRKNGQDILRACSLHLPTRGLIALIGANGAGKTTLLRIIAGQLRPNSGSVQRPHALFYLPDQAMVYRDWSVGEVLLRSGALLSVSATRVRETAEKLALSSVWNKRCRQLSHGYLRRVTLAQVFLSAPKVLLLDEPTNGLDYQQRHALRPLLQNLAQECALLMVSHDLLEVASLAQALYLLQSGRCHTLFPLLPDGSFWSESAESGLARVGKFSAFPAARRAEFSQISATLPPEALEEYLREHA